LSSVDHNCSDLDGFFRILSVLGRLTGFDWRLYFVRKGVGLEYALHNKDGFALLGYLHAKFCDSGERISDNCPSNSIAPLAEP
jgi:hypothetical protein